MALKGPLLALGLAAVAGFGSPAPQADLAVSTARAQWHEIKWPFLLDQWGIGRAFRCQAADCGSELTVYLRPKIGFCNCASGVSDDAEVDRVADIELLSPRYAPLGEGRAVTVGWMKGRSRAYSVEIAREAPRTVVAIAFNDKCDVLVATVTAERTVANGEQAALSFLNGEPILRWAKAELSQQ